LTAWSAILMKEAHAGNGSPVPALVAMSEVHTPAPNLVGTDQGTGHASMATAGGAVELDDAKGSAEASEPGVELWPVGTRFFNGRPIRPVKTMKMVVTAYSPDARSCGEFADGRTATLHSVDTNAHRLVAADPRVLAYGSMLTIPGYDSGHVVPVLDCGGAIKGNRLDLLFPTHEQAIKWGRKTLTVTVWGYVDGKPAPNPRKAREGRSH
jgi:3D (Asp-Asp-Asp) domain-containing protein